MNLCKFKASLDYGVIFRTSQGYTTKPSLKTKKTLKTQEKGLHNRSCKLLHYVIKKMCGLVCYFPMNRMSPSEDTLVNFCRYFYITMLTDISKLAFHNKGSEYKYYLRTCNFFCGAYGVYFICNLSSVEYRGLFSLFKESSKVLDKIIWRFAPILENKRGWHTDIA